MTKHVLIPRSRGRTRDEQEPGTWRLVHCTDGGFYVSIRCPHCHSHSGLRSSWPRPDGTHGHDIAEDGTVSPSIVCPRCDDWHVWGRLEEWEGTP